MGYRGPFPQTEDDREWLRLQALRQLNELQEQLLQARRRFREHETKIGLSFFRERYNDNVARLIVANADCVDKDDIAPDPPLTVALSDQPPFEVALSQLLDQVTSVVMKCLKFWKAAGEA